MSAHGPSSESAEYWQEAAPGWAQRQAFMREFTAPVTRWLVQAIDPQPGQRLLELAAGLGDTGFLAAERVRPGGVVISSDQAQAMLDGAGERAAQLGISNVEFRMLDAEWIDLPLASVDGVLCRFGYMLTRDPAAALRETRRVLRPGGHVALAVWDAIERNPWALLPGLVLRERGLVSPPTPGTPGPFALGDAERVHELLAQAGFQEITLEAIELEGAHPDFATFWETALDLSRSFHDAVLSQSQTEIAELRRSVAERLAPYAGPDGAIKVPARALVAAASA
jgi:SAM-dependent methyltransferase